MPGTTMVESRSPHNPSDVVERVPAAEPETVRDAGARGRVASESWVRMPAVDRSKALERAAELLLRHASEMAELIVREVGKPRAEAEGEVARGAAILRYFAQQALDPIGDVLPTGERSLLYTRRRPRGVVGLITPWNFPLAIPLWKAAPALAFGNGVLLKPSPDAAGVARMLADVILAELPSDLFTLVQGAAPTGQAVLESVDAISFTGSVGVGSTIAREAAARGVAFQTEMGGLNASIVLPDADPGMAARVIANAAMGFAGQKCTATSRVIIVGDPTNFTDALVAAVEELRTGDPSQEGVLVGPVIGEKARDQVLEAIAESRSLGARVLTGGASHELPGWFVAPTLIDHLPPNARLLREEVFGPIAGVIVARDTDEAIAINNAVRYGLVTSVFTHDIGRALDMVDRLDTGQIKINAATSGVDFYAPFGGEKASSAGAREQGKAAKEFYTSIRTVTLAAGVQ